MARELSPSIRETRRDRILQVATEVFFEDGYAAAAMNTISQRLGGSKATLYAYFPRKEDLLEAIILRQCESLFAALDRAGGLPGVADRLKHFGAAFVRVLVSDAGVRIMQLGVEASRTHPELSRRLEEVSIRVVNDQLIGLVRAAHAAGEIDAPEPAVAAKAFVALLRGDLHFRRLLNLIPEPSAADIEAEVSTAVEVFLRAFR